MIGFGTVVCSDGDVRAVGDKMPWPNNVTKADLRIDYYRPSGPGGQKVNKTSSACRITHIPTGIACSSEETRVQRQNRDTAFRKLVKLLIPLMKAAALGEQPAKPTLERVRTYHFPDQRVTDVRVSGKAWRPADVLDGDALDEIIGAVSRA